MPCAQPHLQLCLFVADCLSVAAFFVGVAWVRDTYVVARARNGVQGIGVFGLSQKSWARPICFWIHPMVCLTGPFSNW